MDDYIKKQRFTKIDRQRAGITSPVSDVSAFKVGDCLDFQLAYTMTEGRASSYRAQYLGKTPSEFFPTSREICTQ